MASKDGEVTFDVTADPCDPSSCCCGPAMTTMPHPQGHLSPHHHRAMKLLAYLWLAAPGVQKCMALLHDFGASGDLGRLGQAFCLRLCTQSKGWAPTRLLASQGQGQD